jgi:hypothetical protein
MDDINSHFVKLPMSIEKFVNLCCYMYLLPLDLLSLFSLFPGDRTKPEIRSCPQDQTVYAIPIQRHAFVDWAPPTAWDNKDGQVRYEYMMILMLDK